MLSDREWSHLPLLPLEQCTWREEDVPLHERGVSFEWLYGFVKAINTTLGLMWEQHDAQQKASIHFDNVPWPEPVPYPSSIDSTRYLVDKFIIPLTSNIEAPLFARVPLEYRGKPTLFISHTWDSCPQGGQDCTLDAVSGTRNEKVAYVWIDIACYNQHRIRSVARDMEAIIDAIGSIGFVLTHAPFFERTWCLWELLCAHRTETPIRLYNIDAHRAKYFMNRPVPDFKSIAAASATNAQDRDDILTAVTLGFGSIERADEILRRLIMDGSLPGS
jgi:hypothetical protein